MALSGALVESAWWATARPGPRVMESVYNSRTEPGSQRGNPKPLSQERVFIAKLIPSGLPLPPHHFAYCPATRRETQAPKPSDAADDPRIRQPWRPPTRRPSRTSPPPPPIRKIPPRSASPGLPIWPTFIDLFWDLVAARRRRTTRRRF